MKSFSITGFASSFLWALMERGSFAVVQFVVQVILARVLMPDDFGMLAVMLSLTNVGIVVVQSGLNTALIREPHVSEDDYSTVLWMSLGMGLVLFIGLCTSAPFVARACGIAGLVLPLRAMASMLVVGAFVSVCQARLTREMRFRSIFVTSCVSVVVSGIAGVGCALAGLGVWALVTQQVGYQLLLCVTLGLSLRWIPALRCDPARAWALYAFGWKLMVSGLLESGFQGLLSLVFGRQFGSAALGMVDQGRRWPQAVGYLFDGSIQPVTLSSAAKAQRDAHLLKRMVSKTLCTYAYLTCPCMAALAVSARPVVALLLGEQWLECVPFLQMYCIVYALLPVHTINLQAVNALGRSDLSLKLDVAKKTYGVALLLLGAFVMGDEWWTIGSLVVGGIAGAFVDAIPARRLYGYTVREQARDVVPALALAIVCAALAWPIGLTDMGYTGTLVAQVSVVLGTYVGFSALARVRGFEYARQTLGSLLRGGARGGEAS